MVVSLECGGGPKLIIWLLDYMALVFGCCGIRGCGTSMNECEQVIRWNVGLVVG